LETKPRIHQLEGCARRSRAGADIDVANIAAKRRKLGQSHICFMEVLTDQDPLRARYPKLKIART